MQVKLHRNATTTPAIRRAIQQSPLSVAALARLHHLSETTVRKWKKKRAPGDVADRSSKRHHLPSSFSDADEQIVVYFRTKFRLRREDILEIAHRGWLPKLTMSSLDRCLVRLGVNRLSDDRPAKPPAGKFEEVDAPGFCHADIKYLPKLRGHRSYVYVLIDRFTRYVYAEVLGDKKPETAAGFLRDAAARLELLGAAVHTLVTDNGFEWSDRFAGGAKSRGGAGKPSGFHLFDVECKRLGIEHRLTRPFRPQTNGMVERMNRRVSEWLSRKEKIADNGGKNCFRNHAERDAYIMRMVRIYNRTPLQCLGGRSPLQKTKHNHAKAYTFAGMTN